MVLKKIGEKTLDILVNGTQQGSFTQDIEHEDYNIGISTSSSIDQNLTQTYDLTHTSYGTKDGGGTFFSSSGLIDIPLPANVDIETSASTDSSVSVSVNGNTVVSHSSMTQTTNYGGDNSDYSDLKSITYSFNKTSGGDVTIKVTISPNYTVSDSFTVDSVSTQ